MQRWKEVWTAEGLRWQKVASVVELGALCMGCPGVAAVARRQGSAGDAV